MLGSNFSCFVPGRLCANIQDQGVKINYKWLIKIWSIILFVRLLTNLWRFWARWWRGPRSFHILPLDFPSQRESFPSPHLNKEPKKRSIGRSVNRDNATNVIEGDIQSHGTHWLHIQGYLRKLLSSLWFWGRWRAGNFPSRLRSSWFPKNKLRNQPSDKMAPCYPILAR